MNFIRSIIFLCHFIVENSGIFLNVNIKFIVINGIFFGHRNHILNII
jgi:hypothetical protein